MAGENPHYGAERILGELLKLGTAMSAEFSCEDLMWGSGPRTGPRPRWPQRGWRGRYASSGRAACLDRGRTLLRECLDHILPLSERHVRAVLAEFASYYKQDRPIDRSSWRLRSRAIGWSTGGGHAAVLGGLHHVYERRLNTTATLAVLQPLQGA